MTEHIYETDLFKIIPCPLCDDNAEHPAFLVQAKENDDVVGAVKWNAVIGEYCLFPRPQTAWNWDALFQLLNFLIDVLTAKVLDQAKGPAQ